MGDGSRELSGYRWGKKNISIDVACNDVSLARKKKDAYPWRDQDLGDGGSA